MNHKNSHFILLVFIFSLSSCCSYTENPDSSAAFANVPVLITGGCGFIGSHLAHALVNAGADVTIMDDLSTGFYDNIQDIADAITFIQASITDYDACLVATAEQQIVFHLAAFISVPESMINPTACHAINIIGTLNLLEAARCNNVERFVFSSSAAVYHWQEEICREDAICSPSSPYGYSKYIGEQCCKEYATVYGMTAVILRYFNVYGDHQNPNGAYAAVVAKFRERMSKNLPITIFGDGLQTRDFVPVKRIVAANMFVATAPADAVKAEIFNIATGHSINLFQLIDQLKQEFPNWHDDIRFAPERPGDIKHSRADCSKYQQLIANA
jgi:nucleoside-diphosphate-sugar epimerase